LPGPVGENNLYALHPRGRVLLRPTTQAGLHAQIAAVLATGNRGTLQGMTLPADLPPRVAAAFAPTGNEPFAAALVEGDVAQVTTVAQELAALDGPIVTLLTPGASGYPTDLLLEEVSISINTTAAGGNASLMTIG
jgi:RHH-type proline utilization regulon transcriptional repressor/proline dehydrogenase/delta 1-pyrroline-5-carboxylate dehydrogenase